MVLFGNDWDDILKEEFEKEYYLNLRKFLKEEYSKNVVFPNMYDIFNALKYTAYKDVKVVIIGQDPYHGEGQAHGLSFSVKKGVALPPSLKNIYKVISSCIEGATFNEGELTGWAKEGVLLLNTVLTVRKGEANSHKGKGWEIFTDCVIKKINEKEDGVVFMLWGGNAKAKESLVTNEKHLVLKTVHPSPLSAYGGFFGCSHFSKANEFLSKNGKNPVDWCVY